LNCKWKVFNGKRTKERESEKERERERERERAAFSIDMGEDFVLECYQLRRNDVLIWEM
jgi:hypothetical protein